MTFDKGILDFVATLSDAEIAELLEASRTHDEQRALVRDLFAPSPDDTGWPGLAPKR